MAVLENGFIEFLNHTHRPGYGRDLKEYEPERFYKAMRAFYSGKEQQI